MENMFANSVGLYFVILYGDRVRDSIGIAINSGVKSLEILAQFF